MTLCMCTMYMYFFYHVHAYFAIHTFQFLSWSFPENPKLKSLQKLNDFHLSNLYFFNEKINVCGENDKLRNFKL